MIQWLNEKWFQNKDKLENYFRTHKQEEYSSYQDILRATLENIVNIDTDEWDKRFDLDKIHVIDDGDYQGTLIFLIPKDGYQPDEDMYLITFIWYGSCSGCDTLLNIQESWDIESDDGEYMGLPNTIQLQDYMTLALHMVENARWLENLWRVKNENN